MDSLRSIEIDFEVHKCIELERTSFEETPNTALRRLLGLQVLKMSKQQYNNSEALQLLGRPWSGKGVTLPHGTELHMDYNGNVYTGVIDEGSWLVEGIRCKSPSHAAGAVARTKDGRPAILNGWIYWKVKRPTDRRFADIEKFRKR